MKPFFSSSSGSLSRKILFAVWYLVSITIIVTLALEGLVRAFRLAPPLTNQYWDYVPDPHLPHKPRPSSHIRGRSASDEFDYDYAHNQYGFRDVDHTVEKSDGVFRILGVGDSNIYGVGASFEDSYLYVLEQLLNGRAGQHPKVEIIKAGIPRYFPEPERLLLEHYGAQFKPDLILVGATANDIVDTVLGMDAVTVTDGYLKTREAAEIGRIGTWFFLHSEFARIVLRAYVSNRIAKKYSFDWADILKDNGQHEADWRKLETEYAKMRAIADRMGAQLVVVYIPGDGPWNEALQSYYMPGRLRQWSRSHDTTFVDALPAIESASKAEQLYWPIDGHPNRAGYRVVAETTYMHLVKNNLVP